MSYKITERSLLWLVTLALQHFLHFSSSYTLYFTCKPNHLIRIHMLLPRNTKQTGVKRHWDTLQCELTASFNKQKQQNKRLRPHTEN